MMDGYALQTFTFCAPKKNELSEYLLLYSVDLSIDNGIQKAPYLGVERIFC